MLDLLLLVNCRFYLTYELLHYVTGQFARLLYLVLFVPILHHQTLLNQIAAFYLHETALLYHLVKFHCEGTLLLLLQKHSQRQIRLPQLVLQLVENLLYFVFVVHQFFGHHLQIVVLRLLPGHNIVEQPYFLLTGEEYDFLPGDEKYALNHVVAEIPDEEGFGLVFVGVFLLAAYDHKDIDVGVGWFGEVLEEDTVMFVEGVWRYSNIVHWFNYYIWPHCIA